MKKEKLTDEELDQVVGGKTTQTEEVSQYLQIIGLYDGKGSLSDALNQALQRFAEKYDKEMSFTFHYNVSADGENTCDYQVEFLGEKRTKSMSHQKVMDLLHATYGYF